MNITQAFGVVSGNKMFQFFVMAVIIMSAMLIGIKSHDVSDEVILWLEYMDVAVTVFFVIELSMRFISYEVKREFFKSGWNIFDFIIVAGSLIPMDNSETILLARLLRIFRVLRLVSYIPELKVLINTLIRAIPKMGYVALLMFIIFYIYAAFGNMFFADINDDLWGDVSIALLTLFRVATFEDWTDVMYETMAIYPFSWVYFITFIFLGSFVFLNMMVGIVIDSFSEERVKSDIDNDVGEVSEVHHIYEKVDNIERRFDKVESLLLDLKNQNNK